MLARLPNPIPYAPALEDCYHLDIPPGTWDQIPTQMIPVPLLVSSQSELFLEHRYKGENQAQPILTILLKGLYHIVDGNHRGADALERGVPTILAKVIDYNDPSASDWLNRLWDEFWEHH